MISTIIVSYDTFALTRDAVHAVLGSAGELAHEVIVVDNASPDQSGTRLAEAFEADERVQIVQNDENLGFAAANNAGAALAQGRVLYFLNSDTLAAAGSTERLVAFLDAHPEAGAVGPRVFNGDGTDQVSTGRFRTPASVLRHYLPLTDALQGRSQRTDQVPSTTRPVDIVKGCALMMTREAFDHVGGWDASYFMYSEETELCYALQQAGYTNYFVREAEIVHFGGGSTPPERYAEQQVIQAQSAAEFLRRHYPSWLGLLDRTAGTLGFAARAGLFPLLARLRPARADEYQLRGQAASRLWRWFLTSYQ
ncbi:MAG: glycosyltransferase family 2 protein [Bacteroidota bacterium]